MACPCNCPASPLSHMFQFGAAGQAPGGVGFLSPGWDTGTASTSEANGGHVVAMQSGTLSRFWVNHANPGGVAGNITYTLVRNGIDTGIVLVLAAASAGPAFDLASTLAVTAGDTLSVRANSAAGVGTSQRLLWQCAFEGTP